MCVLFPFCAAVALAADARKAPPIPREIAATDRVNLTRAAIMISDGKFDLAGEALKSQLLPSSCGVYFSWGTVPAAQQAEYLSAAQSALDSWSRALGGLTSFKVAQAEADADVVVRFVSRITKVVDGEQKTLCIDPASASQPAAPLQMRRGARVDIAHSVPSQSKVHTAGSITHLVGQAIGGYLGLAQTAVPADLMGPDLHDGATVLLPTAGEVKLVKDLQRLRLQFLDLARKRVAAYTPRPIIKFDTAVVDAGDVWKGDNAHFSVVVRNTGDAPLEIVAKPSCGCTVANYDKVIPPGGMGKVEADMRTASFQGRTIKVIHITSNDLSAASADVRLSVNVKPILVITPAPTQTLALQSDGPTVQKFRITTDGPDPVTVSHVASSAPFADVKIEPDGPSAYNITLTVSQAAPMGRTNLAITAFSNSKREPQARITVLCDKGIVTTPVSLYFGAIGPQHQVPMTQIVTVSKRDGTFRVKSATCDDRNLEIRQEAVREGSQYRLVIIYRGGWPEGLVKRTIQIETDDPKQPTIAVMLQATVLPGGK